MWGPWRLRLPWEGARCCSSIFILYCTEGKGLSPCQRTGTICHGASVQVPAGSSWEVTQRVLGTGLLGKQSPLLPNLNKVSIGMAAEGMEGAGWPRSIRLYGSPGPPIRAMGSSHGWAGVSRLVQEADAFPVCSCSSAWRATKNTLCFPWGGFAR